jgi:hypothetical protein
MLLAPAATHAHLFHFAGLAMGETQVARDFRLLKELIEWKDKHFDLATKVYRGEIRRRPSNPAEPGFLLKARYQRAFQAPPLKALAVEIDRRYGTGVDSWIEARLAARDEEGVKAGFRTFFYVQIRGVLDGLIRHGDRREVARQLFGVLTDYLFTAFEVHLALNARPSYLRVKDTLEHLRAAAGLADATAASPNEIPRLRARLLSLLAKSLDRRVAAVAPSR